MWRIVAGNSGPPRILWLTKLNRALREAPCTSHCLYIPPHQNITGRFTPWQVVLSTLTGVYAIRNLDKILGLSGKPTSFILNSSLKYCPSSGATRPFSSCFVLFHLSIHFLMLSSIVFAVLLSSDLDSYRSRYRICYCHVHPQEMVTRFSLYSILSVLHRVRSRSRGEGVS